MVDQVSHFETVLRDTIRSPPPAMPLRRHADDDYCDRFTVTCPSGPSLVAWIEPRFKTSGLSGDEWRIRAMLRVSVRPSGPVDVGQRHEPAVLLERGYGRMRGLLDYAPYHVYAATRASQSRRTRALLELTRATLTVERKSVVLMREERPTFGDAMLGMGWHSVSANEGREGVEWHHLTDDEERARCQQVGCADAPRNFYRLKKLQVARSARTLIEPEHDFTGQYAWYCGRHSVRGDCGLEDADANLELVAGPGTATPHGGDESPAGVAVLHV
jgi:hypothetical protein